MVQLGDYPRAIRLMQQSADLSESLLNLRRQSVAHNNMAVAYIDQKDYAQGLKHQREALRLFKLHQQQAGRPPDSLLHAIQYCNLGELYANSGQVDSAEAYLRLALVFTRNPAAQMVLPNTLYVLGDIRKQQNNVGEALRLYRWAGRLTQDPAEQNIIYLRLATLHQAMGARDSSLIYARQSLRVAQQSQFLTGILPASQLLAQLYEGRDDTQALRYYKVAVAAKDSLFSQQKVKQLLTIRFEEQQRQQELAATRQAYRERLRSYGLAVAAGVGLLVALLLWRTTRRQQRSNALLSQQKGELDAQRAHAEQAYQVLQTTQAQLIQKEKMASLGELTAGIAHEIQNPLNFVNNFSEVSAELLDDLAAEHQKPTPDAACEAALLADLKANLLKINHHGRRADTIVRGMLAHSRQAAGTKQPTKLNQLTDEYLRLAYQGARAKNPDFRCDLVAEYDERLGSLAVVPQDIGRVLLNLFSNAFYATQQRSEQQETGHDYQPQVRVRTRRGAQTVEIRVWDNGLGIPAGVQEKVFQPFFTTKPPGQGTGLGLSLSYEIITQGHGGTLQVRSEEGHYTEFSLHLPPSR
ncbi:tetratricopeptide repeat protein [Hymenobacter qilianensis]|uniref:histidine kinase n=1 Tax=Hymenobacter qilianensis TaxID=1385715 RepID=A0A7H0GT91_9BACT|nr:ATP-binding protein [Hymenobacter qilianensis]QNP51507.1 tetratricopeptide repeat protein [Hymenobacter qilianensis]